MHVHTVAIYGLKFVLFVDVVFPVCFIIITGTKDYINYSGCCIPYLSN